MRNIDLFGPVRNRQIRKGGDRGLYGWRRNGLASPSEVPPNYDDPVIFPSEKKNPPVRSQFDGDFAPDMAMNKATGSMPSTDPQSQKLTREVLLEHPALLGSFSQSNTLIEPEPSYNNTGRRNTLLSRKVSSRNNNTTNDQNTLITRQTSNLRHGNHGRDMTRMSYLSSLSSGFGDGLVMSEAGGANGHRHTMHQNRPRTARFSWMPRSSRGDRDTVYTTASVESAPRFRTVNSWVAHQTGHMEKRAPLSSNPPSMPPIPHLSQPEMPDHHRNTSEDPAFRFHPGEEIQISRGSRVPSEILNKKTGID